MRNTIAPDIFRKRLLIEGYFAIDVSEPTLKDFFNHITNGLSLNTYGEAIVHATSGAGKDVNQGYDAFIPLIDSGIYLAVWSNQKFLSLIIYTCKEFDEERAVLLTTEYFSLTQSVHQLF
jgi:hypothetical protein